MSLSLKLFYKWFWKDFDTKRICNKKKLKLTCKETDCCKETAKGSWIASTIRGQILQAGCFDLCNFSQNSTTLTIYNQIPVRQSATDLSWNYLKNEIKILIFFISLHRIGSNFPEF